MPSGAGNIRADYRYGAGAAKPPAGSIWSIAKPTKGLLSVIGPVPARGGADAETADELRTSAPASALTLGRAVSLAAGAPYRDRLLPLPGFLAGRGGGGPAEVAQGLALTGFFLARQVFAPQHQPLPPARERLAARFEGAKSL